MNIFRNLGVGKNLLEQKVLSEFSSMCENIDKAIGECPTGEDMEIISHLDLCVGSIINSLLFGYQFHGEKTEEFVELKKILNEYMYTIGQPSTQFLMSWWPHLIRHLPYFKEIFLEVQRKIMRTYAFFKKQIEEHENDGEYLGDERLDFVSAFMREVKLKDGKEDYDMETLYAHLLDFWIAGQETTTDTLNWGIIHIIHNMNVQDRLHKELDSEIMRIANVLPQNLARRTVQDINVRGHLLRKGTSIQPLISCVLYDENIFPNSRQFLPERFLSENGTLKRFDEFIPFSIGKRFCAGESLARTELFLIFVNLFNQYEISPPKYSEMPSKQQNFGLSVVPLPYKCQIRKRFDSQIHRMI
ncbi:unnamed protein product [Meloidogyne enterolobii]|uniref:Uncharacterized protein n=1 Tax=Meloidogyne enterolobii TaxID=390850 RepID=A0ACB1B1Z0_MELEN